VLSIPAAAAPVARLCVVADDLTGAADAAAAFAARGMRTEVVFGSSVAATLNAEVVALNTGTRDLDPETLEAGLAGAFHGLPAETIVFKKIDSVFRGNTFAEIALTVRRFAGRPCLLAPAFPATGRIARAGALLVAHPKQRIAVFEVLRAAGVALSLVPAGLSADELQRALAECWRRGELACCDAEMQGDLQAVTAAARALSDSVVWIGSAGLAHALAARLPGSASPQKGERAGKGTYVLCFVGSDHPITVRQVESVRALHAPHLLVVDVPRGGITADGLRASITGYEPPQIACLFMTGGDTAAFVCAALGITSLRVVREFAAGIPEAVAVGGSFEGVPLLLKSGGFGHPHLLREIACAFAPHTRPRATESPLQENAP
jgi:uncharacterized protein YgbK (DUF1537 family)